MAKSSKGGKPSPGGSGGADGRMGDLFWPRVLWLGCAAAWAFVVAALVFHNPADPPGHAAAYAHTVTLASASGATTLLKPVIANPCGPVGAFLSHHVFLMLGSGAWALAAFGGAFLGLTALGKSVGQPVLRTIGCVMIALAVSGVHALVAPSWSSSPQGAGGLVAIAGVGVLSDKFGGLGAGLWLALIAAVGAMVAFDDFLGFVPRALGAAAGSLGGVGTAMLTPARALGGRLRPAKKPARPKVRANDLDDDRPVALQEPRRKPKAAAIEEEQPEEGEDEVDEDEDIEADDEAADPDGEEAGAEIEAKTFDPEELRAKISKLPLRFAAETRRSATQEDLDSFRALNADPEMSSYRFPSVDLLENPEENYNEKMESYIREQAAALEEALRVYKIQGEVVGIDSGPVITLYEVKLAPGTKGSTISAVASDIARALKVVNIRVVPNTEGRDTVGIEAPNLQKEKVRLKELMTSSDKAAGMKLPLFLGKDASGEPLTYDLAAMPHLLIAGTTGSGKSVAMNTIIMGFLYTKKPSDLKLVLVDPKMVEMSQFKEIPHLMCPVVTDMGKAAAILEWAVTKMDERYELLAEAGCRDLETYNSTPWEELKERLGVESEEESARIPRKLPRMVFIIDELADLMMTNKEVETSIVRIAQKARAVGIHLILATQRPQANVVTGLIKSNMPSRLCFKVSSGMDSRIVMDQKGGELLLGQGDMLFLSPRSSKLVRAQGTLVEDAEIRRVVKFMREVSGPSFERQLMQIRPGEDEEGGDWQQHAQEDPLFDKAVEIILETGRGSVSLLQRRLAIGYTRSSRLIDLMGMAGIIGEHKGSVAREVMISPEEWEAMKAQAAADAAAGKTPPGQGQLFAAADAGPGAGAVTEEEAPFDADEADVEDDLEGEADDDGEDEHEGDGAEGPRAAAPTKPRSPGK